MCLLRSQSTILTYNWPGKTAIGATVKMAVALVYYKCNIKWSITISLTAVINCSSIDMHIRRRRSGGSSSSSSSSSSSNSSSSNY